MLILSWYLPAILRVFLSVKQILKYGVFLLAAFLSLIKTPIAEAYSTPDIYFSPDQRTITVSYDRGTWNLVRPVVPELNFPTAGKVYWVSAKGNDNYSGTQTSPFATINKGIAVASAGDIIYVTAGIYKQTVLIQKGGTSDSNPLVISSAPGDLGKVKILPPDNYLAGPIVTLQGNSAYYVWFNGFVVEGYRGYPGAPAQETYSDVGIIFFNGAGQGDRISNNVVYNHLHCGIKEEGHGGTNALIQGNIVFENGTQGTDHGIYVPASYFTVDGNIIFNNAGYGIHSYSNPTGQVLSRNITFGNGAGGIIIAGDHNQVFNNTSVSNARGIFYFREGAAYNNVKNNLFVFNGSNNLDYDSGGSMNSYPQYNTDDYDDYFTSADNYGISPYFVQHNNTLGVHTMHFDPLFVNAAAGDFRLLPGSLASNAGSDGKNLGAFISQTVNLAGDLNQDGKVDIMDIRKVLIDFNNPYSIFDLSKVITNFGK